jgi:hypothetical protein
MAERLAGCGTLPATLEAAWDAFELMMRIADDYCGDEVDISAGFVMASSAATAGGNAAGWAPSMPATAGPAPVYARPDGIDPHAVADLLAGLAGTLAARLHQAAAQASQAGDLAACQDAAAAADEIRELMSRHRQ